MKAVWNWLTSYSTTARRSRTVRYMFPAAMVAVAFLGAQLISSTDTSTYVRLQTDKTAVKSGDRFAIDVYVNASEPINAVDITVSFKPNTVEVLEVDRGQSVLTIWTEDPIVESDKVTLRGGTFKKGFLGEHLIARIDMRAKTLGANELTASDIMLLAGDGQGTEVQSGSTGEDSVQLYVYDQNADPSEIQASISVHIVTDIDGDGQVTLKDISAFMSAWSSRSRVYDFNNDGRMSFRDFSIILADFFFGS